VAHARGVYEALRKTPEVRPDLIVAHSGFGSSLFLPYLYGAPIINFFEYYFRAVGQGLGYRPDAPVTETNDKGTNDKGSSLILWHPKPQIDG
jgi:hypothetical protein